MARSAKEIAKDMRAEADRLRKQGKELIALAKEIDTAAKKLEGK